MKKGIHKTIAVIAISGTALGAWSNDVCGGSGLTTDIDGFWVIFGDQGPNTNLVNHVGTIDIGTGSSPTVVVPDLLHGADSGNNINPQVIYVPMALAAGTLIKARYRSDHASLWEDYDFAIYTVKNPVASSGLLLQPVIPN